MRIAFLNCFSEFLKLKLPYQRFSRLSILSSTSSAALLRVLLSLLFAFYTNLVSFLQVNLVFTNLIYRLFFIKCFLNILVISFYLFLSVVQPANKSVEAAATTMVLRNFINVIPPHSVSIVILYKDSL